jgi:hypothetical protein
MALMPVKGRGDRRRPGELEHPVEIPQLPQSLRRAAHSGAQLPDQIEVLAHEVLVLAPRLHGGTLPFYLAVGSFWHSAATAAPSVGSQQRGSVAR